MLVERINKETTDLSRLVADMTWWLDADETLVEIVSSEIIQGMAGWSEAPWPPPDSLPPYDPTPVLMLSATIDETARQLITFVEFGTPGLAYTLRFILLGTSSRKVTIELGVQVTGVPPEQPMPLPPPPSEAAGQGPTAAYLNIKGGTMQGPLYLFENPSYPTEAVTKHYVDSMDWVGGPYLPLAGGLVDGPVTFSDTVTLQAADPLDPLEATTKQYVDGRVASALTGTWLPLTGGTLTGPLTIDTSAAPHSTAIPLTIKAGDYPEIHITNISGGGWPAVKMYGAIGTAAGYLQGSRVAANGSITTRWAMSLGDTSPETGGNVGGNFVVRAFSDTDTPLPLALQINRSTGALIFGGSPQNTLAITPGAATTNPVTLAQSGTGGLQITANTLFPNGTTGAPSIAFAGDPFTGLCYTGGGVGISSAGTLVLTAVATGITAAQQIKGINGSVSLPGYGFSAETNSGLSRTAAGTVNMSILGVAKTTWTASAFQIGSGTQNIVTITPGANVVVPPTFTASSGSISLPGITATSLTVSNGGSAIQFSGGATTTDPVMISSGQLVPLNISFTSLFLGGGTRNSLTITTGAAAANPVTLTVSGAGGLSLPGLVLLMPSLPTSAAGLVAGQVWRNGNVLNIV